MTENTGNWLQRLAGTRLKLDWKLSIMIVVTTLLIMTDYYFHYLPNKAEERFVTFLLIPLLITVILFRKHPKEYGFQVGDWKAGFIITGIAILIIAPILYLAVKASIRMQGYYQSLFSPSMLLNLFLELIGWEFIFRGWLYFEFERHFGDHALWMQAVPFALAHLGKPPLETLSTIFGGFAFGWVARRTRSFLYPFLIHYFVTTFVILVSTGAIR
jgi:membrane protease YdiL (CAAX protease family)